MISDIPFQIDCLKLCCEGRMDLQTPEVIRTEDDDVEVEVYECGEGHRMWLLCGEEER